VAAPGSASARSVTAPPDLIVSRQFRAPRALVWQAWTDPAHIVKWWGPYRYTAPRAEIELRPGGKVSFEMQAPNGRVFGSTGTVDEVLALERLVVTTRLAQDGMTMLEVRQTVTFEERGDETRVTLRAHVIRATDAAASALAFMSEGWNQTLDKLTSYATTTAAERELVITRRFRAEIETVWEAWTSAERLAAWWGPTGFTTTTSRFELTSGGQWAHTMHGPDGTDYPNVITYREIVPNRRLVYEQSGGRAGEPTLGFRATVVFERDEVGTRLTLRMHLASAADKRRIVDEFGAYEGGLQTLDRLADHLQVP
jgi:uncharacterized protein YndB with AHSA1/START domain